jgi:hypothetical protein
MCLAIFKPKNQKFPATAELKKAWNQNPHGAGLAIVDNGKVKIIKGLMEFSELTGLIDSLDGLTAFDVVLHFRWATSGPSTPPPELTHPFPVSTKNDDFRKLYCEADKAIIHNGVMFSPMTRDYSDTAIFSRYMSRKPGLTVEEIKALIGPDRLAIVTGAGVELIGTWIEDDGIFHSNNSLLWKPNYSSKYWDDFDREYFGEEKSTVPLSKFSDPHYWSDDLNDDFIHASDLVGLENCPHCGSEETEFIGVRTKTMECLHCGTVYNEEFMMVGNTYRAKKIKKTKKQRA